MTKPRVTTGTLVRVTMERMTKSGDKTGISRRMKRAKKGKRSGIYVIKNIVSQDCYIGSSIDVRGRIAAHRNDLRKQRHHSPFLQRSWQKYGEEAFEFSVLEFTKPDDLSLKSAEQRFLDLFQPRYNICKTADRPTGNNVQSPESRAKRSASMKRHWANQEERDSHAAAIRESCRSPEWLKQNGEATKKKWENADYRKRMSEMSRSLWQSSDFRQRHKESSRQAWGTPEMRATRSAEIKAKWQDPEYRAMMMAARRRNSVKA